MMVSITLYRHDRLLFPSAVAKGPKKTKNRSRGVRGFTAHLDIDDQASRSSDDLVFPGEISMGKLATEDSLCEKKAASATLLGGFSNAI